MTPLLLLAEKVDGLEGGVRAIDGHIAKALGEYPCWAPHQKPRQPELFTDNGPGLNAREWTAPRYTASTDAAMSLVPKGIRWRLGHDEDVAGVFMAQCTYNLTPTRTGFVVAYSRSAACALVASALRARAAMEAGE